MGQVFNLPLKSQAGWKPAPWTLMRDNSAEHDSRALDVPEILNRLDLGTLRLRLSHENSSDLDNYHTLLVLCAVQRRTDFPAG